MDERILAVYGGDKAFVMFRSQVDAARIPVFIDEFSASAENGNLGVRDHERDLSRQAIGKARIVGVETRNQLPSSRTPAAIQAVRESASTVVPKDGDTWVAAGRSLNDVGACVRGAVVHDQQIPIAIRLRNDAGDRALDRRRAIVNR
jgi:hypothetical protein